ncbi:MAG: MogA/MoaB family molybdenum cofactor biosynthesis protein [Gemmatimonadetes bacterium]|nr:MogA/MoaB family molybdenum cofactor biosynthesis protein [Gemmatimonadota bacterium]
MHPTRIGILTVSDGVTAGTRHDASGDAIAHWCTAGGREIAGRAVVPDETAAIAALLARWADGRTMDVILTTGGTGLTRRDVTPEATRTVIEREAPGIAEAIRLRGAASTPKAALSRGIAGVRAATLIVNLPGSEAGVKDGLDVLSRLVEHAVQLLRGIDTDHHG